MPVAVNDTLWSVRPGLASIPVDALVKTIVDVPALNVKFVVVVKLRTPPTPLVVKVTVLDPKLIVLTLELLEFKAPAVTVKFLVSNVPLVTVRLPV